MCLPARRCAPISQSTSTAITPTAPPADWVSFSPTSRSGPPCSYRLRRHVSSLGKEKVTQLIAVGVKPGGPENVERTWALQVDVNHRVDVPRPLSHHEDPVGEEHRLGD